MNIDIANLVTRLQSDGMKQSEIAAATGCSQSTISDIANGKLGKTRPSYRIVEGLITLAEMRGLRTKVDQSKAGRRRTDKQTP